MKKKLPYVRSKWNKTQPLLAHESLRPHIPKTFKLSEPSLQAVLDEFGIAYMKPDIGTYGQGVMRAEKIQPEEGPAEFVLFSGTNRYSFKTVSSLYETLLHRKLKRSYLVQQGIDLLTYNGRLLDVRVMVQIGPDGPWESTGVIGRLAAPHKVVTNYHNGGTPLPLEALLQPFLDEQQIGAYRDLLYTLGRNTAEAMAAAYPAIHMLGIDVGIDVQMKPWIIEVNTKPDVFIFKVLEDKTMYNKIYQYAKRLGKV
ncbi:YheC/YheD family protein [Paenibacillus filicis]|uniref:YheC/YheD family protein n=1 Tax=Paenibacillus filicis TaxID=669464 RepID=A0ABU9DMD5_9BACL